MGWHLSLNDALETGLQALTKGASFKLGLGPKIQAQFQIKYVAE